MNENENQNQNMNENQNEGDKNRKIIVITAAVLAVVLVIWGVIALSNKKDDGNTENGNPKTEQSDNGNSQSNNSNTSQENKEDDVRPDAKPVFKFFYSKSSGDAAQIEATIEELKQEYGDKVDFDISDLDAHPEYVEQFSVIQPPQLYMLAKNGDFADMKFGTADKAELESAIKKALEQ